MCHCVGIVEVRVNGSLTCVGIVEGEGKWVTVLGE